MDDSPSPFFNLKLMVAVDEEGGIGRNGQVPWNLPADLAWLEKSTKMVEDNEKTNAVIFGHRTYLSVPTEDRPYFDLFNIVLSSSAPDEDIEGVVIVRTWDDIDKTLQQYSSKLESVWVLGGSEIYRYAMENDLVEEIRITQIAQKFDCDAFFPCLHLLDRYDIIDERKMSENRIEYTMRTLLRRKENNNLLLPN